MTAETIEQTTALAVAEPRDTAVMPGFGSAASWDLAQRVAKAFASSSLVPAQFQGNVANCIVALEMANRMGASPLLVMQNLYVVHGNPGWSAKFLIACFNHSGRFSALRYEWNDKRTACRAWSIERATGERIDGPLVSIDMAKDEGWSTKNGSKWKTMPELMLMYRSATFLIRTYAPEISMGLRTDDELIDMEPAAAPSSGVAAVRELLSASAPAQPARTYAQIAEAIKTAASAETAALELDAARGAVPDEQFSELARLFTQAWTAGAPPADGRQTQG